MTIEDHWEDIAGHDDSPREVAHVKDRPSDSRTYLPSLSVQGHDCAMIRVGESPP